MGLWAQLWGITSINRGGRLNHRGCHLFLAGILDRISVERELSNVYTHCTLVPSSSSSPKILFNFLCMTILTACVRMHCMHAQYLGRLEEGVGVPGNGVADSCKLLSGFWKLNPGPQLVLLTAEQSLQPLLLGSCLWKQRASGSYCCRLPTTMDCKL